MTEQQSPNDHNRKSKSPSESENFGTLEASPETRKHASPTVQQISKDTTSSKELMATIEGDSLKGRNPFEKSEQYKSN